MLRNAGDWSPSLGGGLQRKRKAGERLLVGPRCELSATALTECPEGNAVIFAPILATAWQRKYHAKERTRFPKP